MTTAILAQNESSNAAAARVTLSLPSARVLALAASFACHTGLGVLAYAHASKQPTAAPVSHAMVEISLAPSVEPQPVVELASPPPPNELRAATHTASTARSVPVTATTIPNTQATTDAAAAPALPLASAEPAAARFIMRAPVVTAGVSALHAALLGQGGVNGLAAEGAPFAEAQVDSPAKLQAGTPPAYTAAAEAAGVEVELPLEIVIDRTGTVQSARTLEHVGYGLDEAAVAAVRRYRFSPARRAGSAVAVRMRWLLRFQLR